MKIILSVFYLGYFKYAPGTLASLLTMFLCFFVMPLNLFNPLLIFSTILGFSTCYIFSKNNIEKDPSYIVIDEVVGMFLCLLFLPKNLFLYFVAFFLFRFFDILKPSIIFKSQNSKYGIGIMMDDILAALLVNLMLINYSL
tara:strand:- start:291 stop:713 length:423 start_codon:yes stop_codon:yes gene_type:complete